jgi:hypothetical protein
VGLLEQPLWILVGGALLAAGSAAIWVQTRHRLAAWALGLSVLGTIGGLTLERLIVTPAEEVEQALQAIAERLEANDVPGVLEWISPESSAIGDQIRSYLGRVRVRSISIKPNLQVSTSPARPVRSATARFNAVASVEGPRDWTGGAEVTVPRRLLVRFRRGDNRWLVTDYEVFGPRGEPLGRGGLR